MMNEKDNLDKPLEKVDPNCTLDEDQKKVILSDADHCMVVAGAGSGKTTTIAAKIRYLVKHENVDANHILVLSFARKAFAELKERIEKYGVTVAKSNEAVKGSNGTTQRQQGVNVYTFHAFGNKIIRDADKESKIPRILESAETEQWIAEIFHNSVMKNKSMIKEILLFFSCYFDAPDEEFFFEVANGERKKLRNRLVYYTERVKQGSYYLTLNRDLVRSYEENQIANFLYLNSIDYEYEPVYPYGSPGENNNAPYTPDFLLKLDGRDVYYEHFGVSKSGENDLYDAETEKGYNEHMEDKIKLHNDNGTKLIWTYSGYKDSEPLLIQLEQLLIKEGFQFCPRSDKDEEMIDKKIERMQYRYEEKMARLVKQFISDFKANGYDNSDKMIEASKNGVLNDRSKLFLKICAACYDEYDNRLKKSERIDFEDMINQAVKILHNIKNGSGEQKLDYKYVFVDEFQDISKQRFEFIKAISEGTNAKMTVVGDDWQSIFAFAGSMTNSFKRFNQEMSPVEVLTLEHTYRNSQELLNVAGNFIQKNSAQFSKTLQSPKHLKYPVKIYTYKRVADEDYSKAEQENIAVANAVEDVLKDIDSINSEKGNEPGRILLLGRYHSDLDRLMASGRFFRKNGMIINTTFQDYELELMTVHESKGLGYDDVILLNGKNSTYGFPSQLSNDPVLELIPDEDGPSNLKDDTVDFPEERRLFYVALTRTKNRVYIVAPQEYPSQFLVELKEQDKEQEKISGEQNIVVKGEGEWDAKLVGRKRRQCPLCGAPLIYIPKKRKSYGVDIYVCSNEATNCDFITNDTQGKKMSITKCPCPDCDGYLIVKNSKTQNEYFLGCQNYNPENGCREMISMKQFYEDNGYAYPEDE